MNIFYKRPLCLILCVMLGGFVFFERGSVPLKHVIILASALIFIFSSTATLIFKKGFVLSKAVPVLLLISVIFSNVYFNRIFDASKKFDGEVEIKGTVYDIDDSPSYTSTLFISTDSIDGRESSSGYKIILKVTKDDAAYAYENATVTFKAELAEIKATEDFDSRAYYFSRGISAAAKDYRALKFSEPEKESLYGKITYLRENISRRSMLLMGAEAGSLFAALFMGQRSYLSPRLTLDFRRIGISHILALSGMHLAILSIGLGRLLSLFGFGKKTQKLFTIVFAVLYMSVTGFSPSVVRAGIMLIISSLLYLFASARDLPTNLAISVFIICIATPYAIYDASLWLSAFATLGIVSLSELGEGKSEGRTRVKNFLFGILSSFASSFFAISATLLIGSTFTSSISMLGALSTFIFSFLVEIFIYIGIFVLILGSVIPFGKAVMSPLSYIIDKTADLLSSSKFALVSTDERQIRICIIVFSALFFAFLIIKVNHIKLACTVLVFSFLFLHLAAAFVTYNGIYTDDILYTASEKHDIITLKSGGKCAAIDICPYSENSGYETVGAMTEQNIFTLDVYIASHYSFGLDDAIEVILSYIKTKTVMLPEPLNSDEHAIYKLIELKADEFNVKLVSYSKNEMINIGDYTVSELYRVLYGEDTVKCAFFISSEKKSIVYLGSGMLHYATRDESLEYIKRSDTVIFGKHGKTYTPEYTFGEKISSLKKIIIGGEKIHIGTNAERFYKEKGTEILTYPDSVSLIH